MNAIETLIIEETVTNEEIIAIAHLEIAAISFDAETEEAADAQFAADAIELAAFNSHLENQSDWALTSF